MIYIDKFQIFNHLTESFITIGKLGGFEVIDNAEKAVITYLPSPSFNYISINNINSHTILELKNKQVPFICLPQQSIEDSYTEFCNQHNLIKATEAKAHQFKNLQQWNYIPNPKIIIKQITAEHELQKFDIISGICFEHDKELASKFLYPAINNKDFALFLAFYQGQAVGCSMISLINNIAGLY